MSEYGGEPGIIQPDNARLRNTNPAAAAAGLGHDSTEDGAADRRGVRDAAMVVRRAGRMEAAGVPESITYDADGNRTVTPYTEDRARDDLINGKNSSIINVAGGSSAGL